MKKISYKIISIVLSILMVTSCMPYVALADTNQKYTFKSTNTSESGTNEVCTWNYDSETRTLYIDGETITATDDCYLPAYYNDSVTGLRVYCWTGFEHLVFGKNVAEIVDTCCYNEFYPNLTTVEFEEDSRLRSIGAETFSTTNFESIELPKGLEIIGYGAFIESKLKSITIPSSVVKIESSAFLNCQDLTEVIFEDRTAELELEGNTFGDTSITSFDFSDVKLKGNTVPVGLFDGCTELKTVTLTDDITSVGENAFFGCSSLKSIDFTNIETIESNAFAHSGIESVYAQKVTGIDSRAFDNCHSLTEAYFSNVTTIGDNCFSNDENLVTCEIPKVQRIEKNTFQNDSSLEGFSLLNITYIGSNAFENCTSLGSSEFSNELTEIGAGAFKGCTDFKFTSIPASVKNVYDYAFQNTGVVSVRTNSNISFGSYVFNGCNNLKTVNLYDNQSYLGVGMFSDCANLENVTLPSGDSLTAIAGELFRNSGLKQIVIPSSVKSIGANAFAGSSLTGIDIPEYVTTIGESAFAGTNLSEVILLPNVERIGSYAFADCGNLSRLVACRYNIYLGDGILQNSNPIIYSAEGSAMAKYAAKYGYTFIGKGSGDLDSELEDKIEENAQSSMDPKYSGTWYGGSWRLDKENGILYINGDGVLKNSLIENENGKSYSTFSEITNLSDTDTVDIVIGEGITGIYREFYKNNNAYKAIDTLTLPDSCKSVGSFAFYSRTVKKVIFGAGIETIEDYAFYRSNTTSLEFPDDCKLTTIEDYAFKECRLTELTVPKTVTSFGSYSFQNNKIENLDLSGFGPNTTFGYYTFSNAVLKTINFGSISSLSSGMFRDSTGLKELTLPNTIKSIGDYAFAGCRNLKKVTLGEKVTFLSASCFRNCTALSEINLENVKGFGDSCFAGCTSITNVNLNSLTGVGSNGFKGCSRITGAYLPKVTYIGEGAFQGCIGLVDVYMPMVTSIEGYAFADCSNFAFDFDNESIASIGDYAFMNNDTIESLTLHNRIKIGTGVFKNCKNLTTVNVDEDVTNLGTETFMGCTSLATVNMSLDQPITFIGSSLFRDCPITSFIVPKNVNSIGSYAFSGCTRLEMIILGKNIGRINEYAFAGCKSLKALVVPRYSMWIGNNLFADNTLNSDKMLNVIGADSSTMNEYVSSHTSTDISYRISAGVEYTNLPQLQEYDLSGVTARSDYYSIEDRPQNEYGTWEGGIWYYQSDKKALYIDGTGTLTNTFKNGAGDSISFSQITQEGTTGFVTYIGNGITAVADNFACNEKRVVLPSLVFKTGFLHIGDRAFSGCSVNSISINNSMTDIGDYAFYNCNVSTIKYSSSGSNLNSIGDYAFYNGGIKSVPNISALQNIGAHAFEKQQIKSFNGDSLNITVGDYAFYDNPLSSVIIGKDNTVGEYAFANSGNVTGITINEGVTAIPKGAFKNDSAEVSAFPDSLTYIGDEAFFGAKISKIDLGDNITYIGSKAFYDCEYLTQAVIGSGVCTVGSAAFGNCEQLRYITINAENADIYYDTADPSKAAIGYREDGSKITHTTIKCYINSTAEDYANRMGIPCILINTNASKSGFVAQSKEDISNANAATWAYYEDVNTLYISGSCVMSGDFRDENGDVLEEAPKADKIIITNGITGLETSLAPIGAKEITISNSVVVINDCFKNCDKLEYISIPNSVKTMCNETFKGCKSLKSLSIGTGIKTIPKNCASGCTSLKFLYIYGSTTIDDYAFKNCSSLQAITIPDVVETINQNAFENCHSVFNITFGKNLRVISNRAFANLPMLDTITYSGSVSYINSNAFDGSSTSTSGVDIVLNDDVVTANVDGISNINVNSVVIGKRFNGFVNIPNIPTLKEYTIADTNDNDYTVYKGCLYQGATLTNVPQGLDSVEIKQGTIAVGDYAFDCSNVNTIRIPEGIKTIGDYAFYQAKKLKSVRFSNTVESIGNSAFEQCTKLKTISIPYPCKSIGNKAFKNCKILASVILPEGLETVGNDCFNGCVAMESIVFPQSVESIGVGALAFNPNLKSIYVWYATLGYNVFCESSIPMIYTMAGSNAHGEARTKGYTFTAYTDEALFADLCFEAIDVLSGHLGYCTEGHGDIEWLTVYEGDCENDGYQIGVCEYCSEILDEKHTYATGHEYSQIAYIKETETDYGIRVLRCNKCATKYTSYYEPLGQNTPSVNVCNVSGKVFAETGNENNNENMAIENAEIVINDNVVAKTDENGYFRFKMKSGTYIMEVRYIYGFTRYIGLSVTDHDVTLSDYDPITIVACDFNRDGVIDAEDQSLFMLVIASKEGDTSYLKFIDLNNDGYINAKDYVIIKRLYGQTATTYQYPQRNMS